MGRESARSGKLVSVKSWIWRRRNAKQLLDPEIGKQIDYEALKPNGYREQGIVGVGLDDHQLNDFERQFLKNIGGKLYGPI